jgi:photosystem II stability/assembly factor-like uncharacterized protein
MKTFTLSVLLCLFATFNLSAQWVRQTAPGSTSYLNSVNFVNKNSGVLTGWGIDAATSEVTSRAYITTNGGSTWNIASVPDSSRWIVSAEYITSQIVYAAGAINLFEDNTASSDISHIINGMPIDIHEGIDYISAAFFKSTDGGLSWKKYGTMPADCYNVTHSDFVNANTGMAIGLLRDESIDMRTNILKTTDGGFSWIKTINDDAGRELRSLTYVNENLAFATGIKYTDSTKTGFVIKTTNGGINWTTILNDSNRYAKVFLTNNTTGYLAGNNSTGGMVLKTTDQGNSWSTICERDSLIMLGIDFYQESGVGIAYGVKFLTGSNYKPFAMRTTNFGQTWALQVIEDGSPLMNLGGSCLTDKYTYYMAGGTYQEGRIYHTSNGGSTSVNNNSAISVSEFSLSQNFPNPFNPVTAIKYNVPNKSFIVMKVYNSVGKEIVELVNEVKAGGVYEVKFDASSLPSGVYYYKLTSENYSETKKMILIK